MGGYVVRPGQTLSLRQGGKREKKRRKKKEKEKQGTRNTEGGLATEYSYIAINPFSLGSCTYTREQERATCLDTWPHRTEKHISEEYRC